MKYFTVEWWSGELSDEESDAVPARYEEHLRSIRHLFAPGAERIQREVPLHDARLRSLQVNVAQATMTMALDLADGGRVRLRYSSLRSFTSSADPEKGLSGPYGYGDLGYDEFDVLADGAVEHRILFSSGIELAIVCADVSSEPS